MHNIEISGNQWGAQFNVHRAHSDAMWLSVLGTRYIYLVPMFVLILGVCLSLNIKIRMHFVLTLRNVSIESSVGYGELLVYVYI